MVQTELLYNALITNIEAKAADCGAVPGTRGYKARVAELAIAFDLHKDTIDAVITKKIGETWKTIKPNFPLYKISSFGRVRGINGNILRSYHSKSGTELVDPYDLNGKRKHLSIKRAVSEMFLRKPNPRKNEKVRYRTSRPYNTVANLTVA